MARSRADCASHTCCCHTKLVARLAALRDMLEQLPPERANRIAALLPYR